MADQRRNDRGRGRWESPASPRREEPPRDPGAYIGRIPERAAQTIPGGVGRGDVRVSAVATQRAPVSGTTDADAGVPPDGNREGGNTTDDAVREAGQNR